MPNQDRALHEWRPVQGISAHTGCFNCLSYQASDSRRVHGRSPKHLQQADLYLEDTTYLSTSSTDRLLPSPYARKSNCAALTMLTCMHFMLPSLTLHSIQEFWVWLQRLHWHIPVALQ